MQESVDILFCNSEKKLEYIIKRNKLIKKEKIVLCTSDYLLYTCMLEENSFFDYFYVETAKPNKFMETVDIFKSINKELFEDLEKKYLLEIEYHIEGGIGQTVTKLLNSYDLMQELFSRYRVNRIYAYCNEENSANYELLYEFALKEKIPLVSYFDNLWSRCLYSCTDKYKNFKYFCYILKNVFWGIKRILFSAFLPKRKMEEKQYEIGILFASESIKHINWSKDRIRKMNTNFRTNVICCLVPKAYTFWKKEGINATLFDYDYLGLKDCVNAVFKYCDCLRIIWKRIAHINEININKKELSNPIVHRLKQHLLLDGFRNFLIDAAMKNFFRINHFEIIETWFRSNDIFSRMAYYNTRETGTLFYGFLGTENTLMKMPVFEEVDKKLLSFCFFRGVDAPKAASFFRNSGYKGETIILHRSGWKNETYEKNEKSEDVYTVLYAPSYPADGYFSHASFEQINTLILEKLPLQNVEVLVKYHMNHDKGIEKRIEKRIRLLHARNKVIIVNREEEIQKYIDKADLVITTNSSVIVDAIRRNTPVITLLEGDLAGIDERFENTRGVFKDTKEAIEYIISIKNNQQEVQTLLEEEQRCMISIFGDEMVDTDFQVIEYLKNKLRGERV